MAPMACAVGRITGLVLVSPDMGVFAALEATGPTLRELVASLQAVTCATDHFLAVEGYASFISDNVTAC